jgi:hypothetical protein
MTEGKKCAMFDLEVEDGLRIDAFDIKSISNKNQFLIQVSVHSSLIKLEVLRGKNPLKTTNPIAKYLSLPN